MYVRQAFPPELDGHRTLVGATPRTELLLEGFRVDKAKLGRPLIEFTGDRSVGQIFCDIGLRALDSARYEQLTGWLQGRHDVEPGSLSVARGDYHTDEFFERVLAEVLRALAEPQHRERGEYALWQALKGGLDAHLEQFIEAAEGPARHRARLLMRLAQGSLEPAMDALAEVGDLSLSREPAARLHSLLDRLLEARPTRGLVAIHSRYLRMANEMPDYKAWLAKRHVQLAGALRGEVEDNPGSLATAALGQLNALYPLPDDEPRQGVKGTTTPGHREGPGVTREAAPPRHESWPSATYSQHSIDDSSRQPTYSRGSQDYCGLSGDDPLVKHSRRYGNDSLPRGGSSVIWWPAATVLAIVVPIFVAYLFFTGFLSAPGRMRTRQSTTIPYLLPDAGVTAPTTTSSPDTHNRSSQWPPVDTLPEEEPLNALQDSLVKGSWEDARKQAQKLHAEFRSLEQRLGHYRMLVALLRQFSSPETDDDELEYELGPKAAILQRLVATVTRCASGDESARQEIGEISERLEKEGVAGAKQAVARWIGEKGEGCQKLVPSNSSDYVKWVLATRKEVTTSDNQPER